MSMHHYQAGHRVRVATSSLSGPATKGEFEIMRRHPVEGSEAMYTLRSIPRRHGRMVPEKELIPAFNAIDLLQPAHAS
jgi:hypothetical protein